MDGPGLDQVRALIVLVHAARKRGIDPYEAVRTVTGPPVSREAVAAVVSLLDSVGGPETPVSVVFELLEGLPPTSRD